MALDLRLENLAMTAPTAERCDGILVGYGRPECFSVVVFAARCGDLLKEVRDTGGRSRRLHGEQPPDK